MNIDTAFIIGDSHLVCEDYPSSYQKNDKCGVILCDGCSSSEMVDVGARLLALTARDVLLNSPSFSLKQNIVLGLKTLTSLTMFKDLPQTMLDATLMIAQVYKEGCTFTVFGDGVIALKKKNDDNIAIIDISYPTGYPRYLSYKLNFDRENDYILNTRPIMHVNRVNEYLLKKDQNQTMLYDEYFEEFYPIKDLEWLAIMSDGVHSFRNSNMESIDYTTIIKSLTDFKTTAGDFVKRRLNRFTKECKKLQWTHYDDVSLAAIYFD